GVTSAQELGAGKRQTIQGALRVEEKGLAARSCEEAVVTKLRHVRLEPGRDGCAFEHDLPAIAGARCVLSLDATHGRRLAVPQRGELYSIRDIGDGIAAGVDLQLIDRLGRERLCRRRSGRVDTG